MIKESLKKNDKILFNSIYLKGYTGDGSKCTARSMFIIRKKKFVFKKSF